MDIYTVANGSSVNEGIMYMLASSHTYYCKYYYQMYAWKYVCMYVCRSQPRLARTPWDSLIPKAVTVNVFFFKLHECKQDCMDWWDMSWCASDAGNIMIPFGLTGGPRLGHKSCVCPTAGASQKNRWTFLMLGWPLKSHIPTVQLHCP